MFGIDNIISDGLSLAKTIADKVAPDANLETKGKIDQALLELNEQYEVKLRELAIQLAQIELNKIEASNSNLFISGWRPFIGWVCGVGFCYSIILEPIARFIATVIFSYLGAFPVIDTNLTIQVLMAILGLGGMRTYEKLKGVTK